MPYRGARAQTAVFEPDNRGDCQFRDILRRGTGIVQGFGLTIEELVLARSIAVRGELDLAHAYTFDEELRRVEVGTPRVRGARPPRAALPRLVRACAAARGSPPRAQARASTVCPGPGPKAIQRLFGAVRRGRGVRNGRRGVGRDGRYDASRPKAPSDRRRASRRARACKRAALAGKVLDRARDPAWSALSFSGLSAIIDAVSGSRSWRRRSAAPRGRPRRAAPAPRRARSDARRRGAGGPQPRPGIARRALPPVTWISVPASARTPSLRKTKACSATAPVQPRKASRSASLKLPPPNGWRLRRRCGRHRVDDHVQARRVVVAGAPRAARSSPGSEASAAIGRPSAARTACSASRASARPWRRSSRG